MKVILTENVKKLGSRGDLVEISDGYARNYLIPRGLAEEATSSRMKEWKEQQSSREKKALQEKESAEKLRKHLQGKRIVISASCGDTGKLFGSITTSQIAESLKTSFQLDIDKKDIKLKEPIKNLGDYPFTVRLHSGIDVDMTVSVEEE